MTEALVVLVTVPSRDLGEDIAAKLVTERLAACVNVVGPVRSVYRWKNDICRDDEHLLVIKTGRERYPALEDRVCALHPYAVPEVIALPVEAGSRAYLSWVFDEIREAGTR
jgi:periplasmic divalent cation tolerance protein